MKTNLRTLFLALAGIGLLAPSLHADANWPQWRGPHFDGSSDAANLPATLDKDKPAWATQLPGAGNGTPVVFGDRVFVSCVDPQSAKLLGVCVSRTDGHILWSKEIGTGFTSSDRNNAASPSAVTDGKTVYYFFSTGDLAAFDMEGKPLWQRNIQKDHGKFNILWIYSSSPLLYKGKLYIQVIHRNVESRGVSGGPGGVDSYLLALDPATGRDLWSVVRPSDAVGESRESYATPIPFEHDGRSEIVLVGGDCVTCHDAETGKELWRAGGWNQAKHPDWRLVPSVCTDEKDGLIFACAPKGGPVMAIKDGGSGDVTATHFAWKTNGRNTGAQDGRGSGISSDVCVPLFYKDNLYLLNGDTKTLYCLDPKTSEKKCSVNLGGHASFRASPSGADGKIYCMNEDGEVWVVSADQLKVLSQSSFEEKLGRGSIAVVDGMVLVRVGMKLFAFRN